MANAVTARMDEHLREAAESHEARCVLAATAGEGGENQDELFSAFNEPLANAQLIASGLRGAATGRLIGASERELSDFIASDVLPAAQARVAALRTRHLGAVGPAQAQLSARVAKLNRPRRTALNLLSAQLTPALFGADTEVFLARDAADRFAADQRRLLAASLTPAVLFAAISDVPADDSTQLVYRFEARKLGRIWALALFRRSQAFALLSDGRLKWGRTAEAALAADADRTMLPPLTFAPRAPRETPTYGRLDGEFEDPAKAGYLFIHRGAALKLEFEDEAACVQSRNFFERFAAARRACTDAGTFGSKSVWAYCLERGGLTTRRIEVIEEASRDANEALASMWALVAASRTERVRAARCASAVSAVEAHAVREVELASAAFRALAVDHEPAAARRARAAERLALARANVARFAQAERDLVLLLPVVASTAQLPAGYPARLAAASKLALARSPAMTQLTQAHEELLRSLALQEARATSACNEMASVVAAWAARHPLSVAAGLADPAAAHSLITQLVREVPVGIVQGFVRRTADARALVGLPPYAFAAALALGVRLCEAEVASRATVVALGIRTLRESAKVNGAAAHLRADACLPSVRRTAAAETFSAAQRVVAGVAAAQLAASAAALLDAQTSAARAALERACATDEARNVAAERAAEAQLSAFSASVSRSVMLEPRSCASAALAADKARACLALSTSTLLPTAARDIAAAALPPYFARVLSARLLKQATAAISAAFGFAQARRNAEAAFDAAVAATVHQVQPLSNDISEPLPRRAAALAAVDAAARTLSSAVMARCHAGDAVATALSARLQERGGAVANELARVVAACDQQEARNRSDSLRADALVASFVSAISPSVLGRSGRLSVETARSTVTAARNAGLSSLISAVRACGHADYARGAFDASARGRAGTAISAAETCVSERESWQRLEAQWRGRKEAELAGFSTLVAALQNFDAAVDERRARGDAGERSVVQRLEGLVPGPASLPADMAAELRSEARREAARIKRALVKVLEAQDEEWRAALQEATTLLAPAVAALDRVTAMSTSKAAAKALKAAERVFDEAERSLGQGRSFLVTASVGRARSVYESKLRSAKLAVKGLADAEEAERLAREEREREEEEERERRREAQRQHEQEMRDARRRQREEEEEAHEEDMRRARERREEAEAENERVREAREENGDTYRVDNHPCPMFRMWGCRSCDGCGVTPMSERQWLSCPRHNFDLCAECASEHAY